MEISIRPFTTIEKDYSYSQSNKILADSGFIGYLRGDFSKDGKSFFTTWEEHNSELKTKEFSREFDSFVNALRFDKEYGKVFMDRSSLSAYCRTNPESAFEGNYTTEYGFRADTEKHSYILRLNPDIHDYNFYVYAYEREQLDKHLSSIQKMTVLVVNPGESPSVETIPCGLESLQKQVGGNIEAIYPFEEPVGIVCNDEGKINGSKLNRALRDAEDNIYDIITGTFLVVGLGNEDFCSLTPEQIEKFSKLYKDPEIFFMLDGNIQAIPYNDLKKYPLYEKPFDEASKLGEVSAFRLSLRVDGMCKTAIEAAIGDNYSDNRLNPEGAKKVVEIYGFDRVKKILALTVIVKDWDKRITPENKAWAKTVRPNDTKWEIDLSLVIDRVNPGLTDIFIKQVKKMEEERKPSVLKKLESAKENVVPISSAPKKKEQVL